ncbi:MAG: ChbG/HpnK family deacetylase [Aquabacterium sp.]
MPSNPARHLVVCVDDFGLHDGVNQAVVELLALRRISAVSCLVDGPAWRRGVQALRQAIGTPDQAVADVGLHLNFTETLDEATQSADIVLPLGALIKGCYLRRFDVARLARQIERQWDAFEAAWGRPPDFIDGHQHVHQLPQIRDALLQVLARRTQRGGAKPWVRQCRSPGWRAVLAGIGVVDTLKAAVIAALGARVIGRGVARLGLPHSQRLLGVYPFDANAEGYVRRWQAWLQLVRPSGDLIMCHPAAPMAQAPEWPDVIGPSRHMEHAVLGSEAFGEMLRVQGIAVRRFGR